jgi:hypothetical protein
MTESTVRHSTPFWIAGNHDFMSSLQTHPRIIHAELATNNDEYDIVIIGTGLSGVACAYWLRKLYPVERFPRILLLEKNAQLCSGASGRNGGFLRPRYDCLADDVKDFGYDNSCQWIEFERENLRSIAKVVNENKIDCEINITRGNVALACNNQEWQSLVKSYELIKDYINKHSKTKISLDNLELWDHEKCQQMFHSDKFKIRKISFLKMDELLLLVKLLFMQQMLMQLNIWILYVEKLFQHVVNVVFQNRLKLFFGHLVYQLVVEENIIINRQLMVELF